MASLNTIFNWSKDLNQGYPTRILNCQLEKKFVCNFCSCLLRYPVQTGCGERFCRGCSDILLSHADPHCPVCKESLDRKTVFRDMFAERETFSLSVRCENAESQCRWVGQLKDWEDHVERCAYKALECPNGCGEFITMATRDRHSAEECARRRVQCEYCATAVVIVNMDVHLREQCRGKPGLCQLCKAVTLIPDQMEIHQKTECPEYHIGCKYAEHGCDVRFVRSSRPAHMESNVEHHMSLLETSFTQEKQLRTLLEDRVSLLSGEMAQLTALVKTSLTSPSLQHNRAGTGRDHHVIDERVLEYAQRSASGHSSGRRSGSHGDSGADVNSAHQDAVALREDMLKVADKMAECAKTAEESKSSLAAVTRTQALQDVQLADMSLRVDIIDVKATNGVLVWKIGEMPRRRREAVSGRTPSLYSAPFYTSPAGYKMCARVYLDGDGMGKNSYISLFFVLMRGEYDALLQWPFQLRVTLMLMDQSESGTLRRNITEVFKPDRRSASFKQPVSEMNTGSGCPMFAKVNVLDSPTYVKDDTIFIKVVVDKSSSPQFTPPDSDRV